MQPKFTQRNLWSLCAKMVTLFTFFVAISQCSFAQDNPVPKHKITKTPEQRLAEEKALNAADNDAGLPNKPITPYVKNGTEAICTTWTGVVDGADAATSLRAFRDGVPKTCAVPGTCQAGIAGTFQYEQLVWTNPVNAVQCVTVNFTCTSGGFGFVTAHNGSVNIANLCTNWLGDPGSSATVGQTITWSFNAPALATIIFHMTNLGAASGYQITVDAPLCTPPSPCAGTPSPGNTISSVTNACPAVPVNLSLQNSTPGSGVTYAWQRSTVSGTGPWTAFGTNSPTQSTTQTQQTWYRCIVTCTVSGNSGTSTPVQVNQNPFSSCYCASVAGSNADEDIFNVTFGTLNNSSTCASVGPGPGSINRRYANYTTLPPGTVVTGNLPISVQVGTCGGNFGSAVGVWLDMNQNGAFEHPAERIFLSNVVNGPHVASGMVNIPASATIGVTGMRVINVETGTPASITPCGAYTWGETEDYLINIQPCVPVTNPTGPSTFTAQCSGNATLTVNTGSASLPTFEWEYRVNSSSPWQNAVAGGLGGVITSANTATLQLTAVPNSLNGYQFRAVVRNPCTAIDFGPAATLSVVPVVATVTPTSATICNPTTVALSLTNASSTTTACFNATAGLPMAIPDNNPAGANNTIAVSGLPTSGFAVSNIEVTFSIPAHTWVGDLVAVLRAPNGQIINLDYHLTSTGADGDGHINTKIAKTGTVALGSGTAPFTGTFRADRQTVVDPNFGTQPGPTGFLPTTNNWSALETTLNGNWTLAIYDGFNQDFGSLTAWNICITYGTPATGVWTSTPATPNTMWTDPAATIAYTGGPANTIYVRPAANTTYCVVYNTVSPACTSAPVCIPVTVIQPLGTVVQPTNKSVCVGGTTTFSVTAPGGPFAYQWQETRNNGLTWSNISNGGVYSGATTNTLTLTGVTRSAPVDMNNFRYRVVVTTTPCAGSFTSSEATLTVFALPIVTISATDLALLPNGTSTITATSNPAPNAVPNWSWTRDGITIIGATTSSVVADIDKLGVYQATVTDVNGCRNSSNSLLIESEVSDKLWLYPNPTSGAFQVRVYYPGVVNDKRRIQVFNSSGQEVMSRDIPLSLLTSPHYQRIDIDLGMQPGGIYLVRVIDLYTKKAVQGFVIKQTTK